MTRAKAPGWCRASAPQGSWIPTATAKRAGAECFWRRSIPPGAARFWRPALPFSATEPCLCPKTSGAPRINQSILEHLLEIEEEKLPLTDIQSIRTGEPGQVYRLQGYVTAGTSNPYTRFPETIYIQDDTAGIAVVPFRAEGVQVGTPLDITGYLEEEGGMPVLQWIDYDILPQDFYRYVPKTSRNKSAMDYFTNGGRLMQVEGAVTALTLTSDGRGISRLTLKDYMGDEAEILIEPCIRSGASGENNLASQIKVGRMVRAIGISHLDQDGTPVLRVRNCEEVVYVPPRRVPSDNPKTGDGMKELGWVFR